MKLLLALSALLFAGTGSAAAQDRVRALEFGGGLATPVNGDLREDYGFGAAFTLGWAARVSTHDAWVYLDVGLAHSSGEENAYYLTPVSYESTYWLLPISLGIRGNVVPLEHRDRVRLYAGIGFQTVPTWRRGSLYGDAHGPTLGACVDLRPEFPLGDGRTFWLRERITILADAHYGSPYYQVNHSSSQLQLGISWEMK